MSAIDTGAVLPSTLILAASSSNLLEGGVTELDAAVESGVVACFGACAGAATGLPGLG